MGNTIFTYVVLLLLCFGSPIGICQTQNVGTIQGQVTDSQNNPLIGYTVSAVSQTDKVTYAAKTNSGGEFKLTNLPTGIWDVKLRHFSTLLAQRKVNFTENTELTTDFVIEGYAFTLIVSHPQYQTHQWRWDMSPDKHVYELGKLELTPFLAMQGKVSKSKSDYAVDGLKVQIKMHNSPSDFFRAGAQPEHIVHTDAEGSFLFSELHPIEYSLTISRNDVLIAYLESINPQNKKPLKIRLQKMKTLHGKVVDTKQNPIAEANLYASRRSENRYGHRALLATTQTDANGTFQMQVLETKPHLLSVNVSKKGYLSRVYRNVEIGKDPLTVPLEKGYVITGRVILPRDIPIDGYYEVKVFPDKTQMKPTLNPLGLNRPLLSTRFPITQPTFMLNGLLEEKYMLYITGHGIAATQINIKAATNGKEVFIAADKPTVALTGQVFWSDTGEPVKNALISRSWYPWELIQYDMSLTLDRFETETDAQGRFVFQNLTQERYQLNIRAVQTVFEKETETNRRIHIHKQVTLLAGSDEIYPIYLGKADGTPF